MIETFFSLLQEKEVAIFANHKESITDAFRSLEEDRDNCKNAVHLKFCVLTYFLIVLDIYREDAVELKTFHKYIDYILGLVARRAVQGLVQLISQQKKVYEKFVTSHSFKSFKDSCLLEDIDKPILKTCLALSRKPFRELEEETEGWNASFAKFGSMLCFLNRMKVNNPSLEPEALQKWLDVQSHVHSKVDNPYYGSFLSAVKLTINEWANSFNWEYFLPMHGPGSTLECRGKDIDILNKYRCLFFTQEQLNLMGKIPSSKVNWYSFAYDVNRAQVGEHVQYGLRNHKWRLPLLDHHVADNVSIRRSNWVVNTLLEAYGTPRKLSIKSDVDHPDFGYLIKDSSEFIDLYDILSEYFDRHLSVLWNTSKAKMRGASITQLKFVPKAADKLRTISFESTTNVFVQKGLQRVAYRTFRDCPFFRRHLPLQDQTVNQRMALYGSMNSKCSDTLATLDLSSASDCLSRWIVDYLFQDTLLGDFIKTFRADYCLLPTGRLEPLVMNAPMGAPMTFFIQSMVYGAFAQVACTLACGKGKSLLNYSSDDAWIDYPWYLYGDDAIMPSSAAVIWSEYLTDYGWIVNEDKSFCYPQPYRESCGIEAVRGKDITPLKISRLFSFPDVWNRNVPWYERQLEYLDSRRALIALANEIFRRELKCSRNWIVHLVDRLDNMFKLPLCPRSYVEDPDYLLSGTTQLNYSLPCAVTAMQNVAFKVATLRVSEEYSKDEQRVLEEYYFEFIRVEDSLVDMYDEWSYDYNINEFTRSHLGKKVARERRNRRYLKFLNKPKLQLTRRFGYCGDWTDKFALATYCTGKWEFYKEFPVLISKHPRNMKLQYSSKEVTV